jgi:hypothetical protein
MHALIYRGLLTEPFDRAALGLQEVYDLKVGDPK